MLDKNRNTFSRVKYPTRAFCSKCSRCLAFGLDQASMGFAAWLDLDFARFLEGC